MRKIHYFLLAALCMSAAASCNKSVPSQVSDPRMNGAVTVNIGLDAVTKSAYADRKDFQINKIQIFVFDADDKLETDSYSSISPVNNSTSVTIATFTGTKTVYAVLNHPRLYYSKDTSLSTLESELSDLRDNSPTSLVMSGKNSLTVTEYDRNKNPQAVPQTLNIYVKRLSAMILLDKLCVDFSGTSLEGASFSIQELYLKNVVGKCRLGVSGNTGTANTDVHPLALSDTEHTNADNWYNKLTKQASGAPGVIVDSWSKSIPTDGTAETMSRCLFAYPNKTTGDSHDDAFNQRHTRLVLKAHIKKDGVADTDSYYVFDLPVLQANNIYKIGSITLTMLGKDDDNKDDDLQAGRITPTILVDGWASPEVSLSYEF